jgi:hypothetical protein
VKKQGFCFLISNFRFRHCDLAPLRLGVKFPLSQFLLSAFAFRFSVFAILNPPSSILVLPSRLRPFAPWR